MSRYSPENNRSQRPSTEKLNFFLTLSTKSSNFITAMTLGTAHVESIVKAALQGFHAWRGEDLAFPIRIPLHLPLYIEAGIVDRTLDLIWENTKDYLILRLMSDAGLRCQEVVNGFSI